MTRTNNDFNEWKNQNNLREQMEMKNLKLNWWFPTYLIAYSYSMQDYYYMIYIFSLSSDRTLALQFLLTGRNRFWILHKYLFKEKPCFKSFYRIWVAKSSQIIVLVTVLVCSRYQKTNKCQCQTSSKSQSSAIKSGTIDQTFMLISFSLCMPSCFSWLF